MLGSRIYSAPLLLLLLQGVLLLVVDAKPADKLNKIDGPFIKNFRQNDASRQKRFLDGFFKKHIFDISEEDFLNTNWKGNIFNNHHQYYNPYVPNIPQYFPGWSMATDACIITNNKKISVVSSIRECQMMCIQEASFICRAVEYEPYSGTCSLTDASSASDDYVQPCTQSGWLFIERINDWTEPTYACIYSAQKKILEEKVWTLDNCKTRCIEETNFECRSLGYIWWSQTCSLSPETSYSPNFMMPCTIPQYTYLERIYVSPTTNPCSADPCGANSVCFPNGNSFNCQCADGYMGIPPNCNLNQVTPSSNPCSPSPCGANSVCYINGDSFNCQCADGYTGIPPNCNLYQDCVNQNDCPSTHACVGWKCLDPCENRCGENANCQVYNHYPSCSCQEDYTGNPYLHCSEINVTTTTEIGTSNTTEMGTSNTTEIGESNTTEIGTSNTTTTELPGDKTDTTTEKTQSCNNQSDCPTDRACVGGTCRDPCVARCAPNAECQVHNRQGHCSCLANYTGNPYINCSKIDVATIENVDDKIENTTTTSTELPEDQTETTTEVSQNSTTTESVEDKTANKNATTPELPDDPIETTTQKFQVFETTIAVESPIDTNDKGITTNPPQDQDSDSTEAPAALTEAYTEPTATETSLTEVTDSPEEVTTVDSDSRRRIEFPDFNR